MPGTEARTGANNSQITAVLDKPGGELSQEEGLATALSAFLSQMHYSAAAAPAMYAPDPGPAAVQALRASRLPSLAGLDEPPSVGGTTPGRLPEAPGRAEVEVIPDRPPMTRPARALLPGLRTGKGRGVVARVPKSDAWATPEPATEPEAAPSPSTISSRLRPAIERAKSIDANPAAAAPEPKVDRPAAARAAAVAQRGASLAARTLRARPVPEIAVDDLPEPWLGTEPGDKAEQAQPPWARHETFPSLLEPPAVLNVEAVVNEPTVVSEPTVVKDPTVVSEPTSLTVPTVPTVPTVAAVAAEPAIVHDPVVERKPEEPSVVNDPTVVNDATLVQEPVLVDDPMAELRPNVVNELKEAHEQLLLISHQEGQLIAPAPGASRQRKAAVAGLALAIFAATTLGISVYLGYRTNDTLNQRNLELATTQASLVAVQKSLTDAQSTLLHQHQSYTALKAGIKQVAEQYVATKTQLERVQVALGQTQGQLTQAQGQVGRAQNQLGNTQQNLSTTQSHAVQIQRGAELLQQTVQLLASLIVLENNYITAAQSHNGAAMKNDLAQMRTLEDQAQTLEPTANPPAQ